MVGTLQGRKYYSRVFVSTLFYFVALAFVVITCHSFILFIYLKLYQEYFLSSWYNFNFVFCFVHVDWVKCFSSVIGLLFILFINFIHLIIYFSYISFFGKKLKDFIIILLILLLLSLLLVVFLLLLFVINMHNIIYYYSFYALRWFIAFDSIQSSTHRVTRKVPSNVGILKQRKTTTLTWKAEKLFLSESTCLIIGKMSLS